MGYRIGIDVGGTFTDFLLYREGEKWETYKILTTPEDPSIAVLEGLNQMARRHLRRLEDFIKELEIIVHGTTVTTNAVLTESGARCGLLTTEGFRDILQMRRGIREARYDNKYQPPKPLIPRYLRLPVRERVNERGEAITPLDRASCLQAIETLNSFGVESVAICFMHSYANPRHEREAAELVREKMGDVYLTISSELLPQVRLYDRVSTTALNSYVGPILRGYLTSLEARLSQIGFKGVLLIMQSNGGVISPTRAITTAASTLLSGPAAGPVAGLAYAGSHGYRDCITVDMGGTSFDAALIKDGRPQVITDGKINRHLLALPMLAIHTIGAGGGSIGWIDEGGLLRVGPQSAGARPGPACYGLGGERPTVTDADLVLGYLNKDFFLGGRMPLYYDRALRAIEEHIARPMGLSVIEAACGIYHLVNVNMAQGIRQVSVERGHDPRDFPLVVAGGAGPVHAGMLALELEIPLIIVPRESSIFCAVGMLISDLKHDFVRTCYSPFQEANFPRFRALFAEMEVEGKELLSYERVPLDRIDFSFSFDMRYIQQYHEINIEVTREEMERGDYTGIKKKFDETHDRLYGYCLPDTPCEVMNLRASAIGGVKKPEFRREDVQGKRIPLPLKGRRPIFLPGIRDFKEVEVYDGARLTFGHKLTGPAVVELESTTVIVPPEYDLACDQFGNYAMYLKGKKDKYEEVFLGETS